MLITSFLAHKLSLLLYVICVSYINYIYINIHTHLLLFSLYNILGLHVSSFKPSAQLGRALHAALHRLDKAPPSVPPRRSFAYAMPAPFFSVDPNGFLAAMKNLPRPTLREIGQPRACHLVSSGSSTIDMTNTGISSSLSQSRCSDMESETFMGRSILRKMGWQDGARLGRLEGAAEGPLEIPFKKNRLGLGALKE